MSSSSSPPSRPRPAPRSHDRQTQPGEVWFSRSHAGSSSGESPTEEPSPSFSLGDLADDDHNQARSENIHENESDDDNQRRGRIRLPSSIDSGTASRASSLTHWMNQQSHPEKQEPDEWRQAHQSPHACTDAERHCIEIPKTNSGRGKSQAPATSNVFVWVDEESEVGMNEKDYHHDWKYRAGKRAGSTERDSVRIPRRTSSIAREREKGDPMRVTTGRMLCSNILGIVGMNTLRYLLCHLRILIIVTIFIGGYVAGSHYPTWLSVYTRRPETFNHQISYLPSRLIPLPPTSRELSIFGLHNEMQEAIDAGTEVLSIANTDENQRLIGQDKIPNIVHYVYGLKEPSKRDPSPSSASETEHQHTKRGLIGVHGPEDEFAYYAYLGMRSAMISLKPEKIMFHCIHEPSGYWWEQVKGWEGWIDEHGQKKGMVEVVQASDFNTVGKSNRPVNHYAHKADILRLKVLLEYGGIYLDIDTIILKPFKTESLLMQDAVMGMQAKNLRFTHGYQSDTEMEPEGLCNAIILAKKGSEFLRKWLDAYETFRDNKWAEHSVVSDSSSTNTSLFLAVKLGPHSHSTK